MIRLLLLLSLFMLNACQVEPIGPTCYECKAITASGPQTKAFCDRTQMQQFLEASRSDPKVSYVECKNK